MPFRKPRDLFSSMLLALFSSALCAASIPNEIFLQGLWPLGFIALTPLYIALRDSGGYGETAIIGAVFGATEHAATSFWLFYYHGYAFWTLGTTTIAYAVIYALLSAYLGFFLKNSRIPKPVAFALVWTGFELLKSNGFLGYPWGLLPYSLTSMPVFLQIADITGIYGLSFLLSSSSAIAGEFEIEVSRFPISLPRRSTILRLSGIWALIFCVVVGYGIFKLAEPIPILGRIRMTLIQQNTDPWEGGEAQSMRSNMDLAKRAYEKNLASGGKPIELFVFSETSFQRPYAEYKSWFETNPPENPLLPFLKETGASLLTGAPVIVDWNTYAATNSTILISSKGDLVGSYAKIHPVPFAEAIPFWEYKWFRDFMQKTIGIESGWVMGTEVKTFGLPGVPGSHGPVKFSTPICFEDAFPELCREYFAKGADLLVNLTNDSWSKKKSAQIQHWAIARFRAIENRRTLVRSTNTGLSCVVDAKGNNILEMPQFEADFATFDVPVYRQAAATIYFLWGDWFPKLTLLLAAIEFIYCWWRLTKATRASPPAMCRLKEETL